MRLGAAAVCCSLLVGCLSSAYGVPRDEALRVAGLDPAVRGERLRVVQQLSTDEPPPRATGARPVAYVPGMHFYVGPRVNPGHSSGGLGGGGGGGDGRGVAAIAVAVVVAGVVVGVALAATEGERYDGWARVGPMHPIHVTFPDGAQQWMPLAALDPATVKAASHLELRDDEGPFQDVGRAPLNRVGGTYGMEVGAGQLHLPGARPGIGFISHVQVGGFPWQWLGLLADVSVGLGEATNLGGAAELQLLPLGVGVFHAGAYGRIGGVWSGNWSLAGGVGALVQVEISTRLAFVLRGGASFFEDSDAAFEATAGLAVY